MYLKGSKLLSAPSPHGKKSFGQYFQTCRPLPCPSHGCFVPLPPPTKSSTFNGCNAKVATLDGCIQRLNKQLKFNVQGQIPSLLRARVESQWIDCNGLGILHAFLWRAMFHHSSFLGIRSPTPTFLFLRSGLSWMTLGKQNGFSVG